MTLRQFIDRITPGYKFRKWSRADTVLGEEWMAAFDRGDHVECARIRDEQCRIYRELRGGDQ